jgi:hypothetical protein
MIQDNEFINILKNKRFTNIWSMLQYLIDIGLNIDEIMKIIPEFFSESDYFKDVAYARVLGISSKDEFSNSTIFDIEFILFVGMIDESNRKLCKLFNLYRTAVTSHTIYNDSQSDLDILCKERYEFKNLPSSTIDYLDNIAIKHYGHTIKN